MRFEDEIHGAIEKGIFPGAALLVSHQGQILYRKFFGFSCRIPEEERLTEQTLFDIASLTKPVVAASLTLLARQENRLTLDTSISRTLEPFNTDEKKKMTVRHLLKHTSGLPAWKAYYEEIAQEQPALLGKRESSALYLAKIAHESLEVPMAYQRIYSDLGFIALGIYLEKLFGSPLEQVFQEKIATPLGLKETLFQPNDKKGYDSHRFAATENSPFRKRILRGEVHDENAYALGGVAGHAGLFSGVDNLHLFLTEYEKGFRGQSLLFPQEAVVDFVGSRVKIKLGWDTPASENSQAGQYFSRNSIGHLGFTGCSFWLDFDQSYQVIFLTNRVHPTSENQQIASFRPLLHNQIYEELIRS